MLLFTKWPYQFVKIQSESDMIFHNDGIAFSHLSTKNPIANSIIASLANHFPNNEAICTSKM